MLVLLLGPTNSNVPINVKPAGGEAGQGVEI